MITRTSWFAAAIWSGLLGLSPALAQCDWRADFVGRGLDGFGFALTTHTDVNGSSLYVGGGFTQPASRVARWDGSAWHALGAGLSDEVYALAFYDDGTGAKLYAGGRFNTGSGAPGNHIARWNGSSWQALGAGTSGPVYALAVHNDGSGSQLYVGGRFLEAGGQTVNRIARWNGSDWSGVGGGVTCETLIATCEVRALRPMLHNQTQQLFVGGFFTDAGGVDLSLGTPQYLNYGHIARWNGSTWGNVNFGVNSVVRAVTAFDEEAGSSPLRIGGQFTLSLNPLNRVGRNRFLQWLEMRDGFNGLGVYALEVIDPGNGPALFAAGDLSSAPSTNPNIPGVNLRNIGRWNGASWEPLGSGPLNGVNGEIYALAEYDDGSGKALYATGAFLSAGALQSPRITKWQCLDPPLFANGFE